jgi:hypothetical protein
MSIEEEKPSEFNGESSSRAQAIKRERERMDRWLKIVLVVLVVVMPVLLVANFLTSSRSATLIDSPGALTVAATIIGALYLILQATYATAYVAGRRDNDRMYWLTLTIMVAYTFLLITIQFATIYWIIGTTENFSVELSHWGAIYFALGTLTTAGTGTIAPTSDLARAIVSGQMILDFVFVAIALTRAVTRWSESRAQ